MEVLQRKKDGTQVISARVPSAIYTKLVELRRRANLLGFTFNATLAEPGEQGDSRGAAA